MSATVSLKPKTKTTRSKPGLQGADYTAILKKVLSGQRTTVMDSAPYFVDAFKKWRRQSIDIEVEFESEDASAENPENPITLISIKDNFIENKAFFFTNRSDFIKRKGVYKYHEEHTKRDFDLVVFWYPTEVEMLEGFFYFIKKTRPDMMYGWYFEDFDVPYIINRARLLEVSAMYSMSPDGTVYSQKNVVKEGSDKDFNRHGFRNVISGITLFDMKWGYTRIQGLFPEGNGLNQVALRHLGYGKKSSAITEESWYNDKVPTKFDAEKGYEVDDFKEEGFFKFIIYGFYDVLLPELIENVCYTIFTFFFITRFTSIEWEKLHHFSVAIDMAQLMYKDPSLFLPSKKYGETIDDYDIEGGAVENPPVGMIPGYMIVLDASRQYPNMIRDANLGVDTYIEPADHEKWKDKDVVKLSNGDWFRKDFISFLSDIVTKIFSLRDFVDKQLEEYDPTDPMYLIWSNIKTVVKNLINAIYGANGNPHTRMFHLPTARSITLLGRELLEHDKKYTLLIAKKLASGISFDKKFSKGVMPVPEGTVLKSTLKKTYGDTDSLFSRTKEPEINKVVGIGYYYSYFMNKSLQIFCKDRNMFGKYVKLEFEAVYMNMFFPAKFGEERGTKKQYCLYMAWKDGKYIDPPKFKIMGMAGKKSNTPLFAKDIQINFLKTACKGASSTDLEKYVVKIIKECKGYMKKTCCYKCGQPTIEKNPDGVKEGKPMRCTKCNIPLSMYDIVYDARLLMKIGTPYRLGKQSDQYNSSQIGYKVVESIKRYFKKKCRKAETYLYFWTSGRAKTIFAMNPESPKVPRNVTIDEKTTIDKIIHDKLKNILPLFKIDWDDVKHADISTSLSQYVPKV